MIVGVASATEMIVRDSHKQDNVRYHIVGFVDDSHRKKYFHMCPSLLQRFFAPFL